MKNFLAFDASGEELVVGVGTKTAYTERRLTASGTENLLVEIDKCLKKSRLTINDVDSLVVGIGPGSWTGSRVAVVTAFGLISGNPKLNLSVFNSFDLISYNVQDKEKTLKLVKAYANFVYIKTPEGEIKAIKKDELNSTYKDFKLVGFDKVTDNTEVVPLDLQKVALDKMMKKDYVNPELVEPMYLRLSQAEYQRLDKLKEKNDGN